VVAIDCNIDCCDLLDIAHLFISQKKYGVACNPVRYCDISKYYLAQVRSHVDCSTDPPVVIDPDEEDVPIEYMRIQFIDHVCQEEEIIVPPPATYWECSEWECETEEEENTGQYCCNTLTEYYVSTNLPTGQTKPNVPEDEDYVPCVTNEEICYLTYTPCDDFSLAFESYEGGVGLFSVGEVVSLGNEIGDYLISWHLGSVDGDIVFRTGVGSDPLIQATHPFTDEPVMSGDLYPVIEYIWINFYKYTSSYEQGSRYAPDLIECLDFITVDEINCSSTQGTNPTYPMVVSFTANVDPLQDAEREFVFMLSDDGSTNYFAYWFYALAVADKVTISYVSVLDPENPVVIDEWIIGSQQNSTDYNANPKRFSSQSIQCVCDLTEFTYTLGDYLLIHVTPRIMEPENLATSWSLYFKCLTTFECDCIDPDANIIDDTTPVMVWDEATCNYVVTFDMLASFNHATCDLFKYHSSYMGSSNGTVTTTGALTQTVKMRKRTACTAGSYGTALSCVNQTGSATISKVGNVITLIFEQTVDYDRYKNNYNALIATTYYTNYSPLNSNINHYRNFLFNIKVATGCSDVGATIYLRAHFSSTITWNDSEKKLTISLLNTTNGLPDVECNDSHSQADTRISYYQATIDTANFSYSTQASYLQPIGIEYIYAIAYDDTQSDFYFYHEMAQPVHKDICDIDNSSWCRYVHPFYNVYFDKYYRFYVRVVITDTADPENNWRLINMLDPVTGCMFTDPGDYVIVYEIEEGIQIIPTP